MGNSAKPLKPNRPMQVRNLRRSGRRVGSEFQTRDTKSLHKTLMVEMHMVILLMVENIMVEKQ